MEVSTQNFRAPSTWTRYIGLSILITQIAVIIYIISPIIAAIFAGLGIFFYVMEVEMHPILSRLMAKRQSQHVIGRIKSKQAGSKKIVITAHIDTARADYPHHPQRVTSFRKLAIMNMIILILIFLIYSIGALFNLSNIYPFQYRMEWLFSLVLVIPTLYSSFLLVLREWRYEIVPGANDNASGVSVALEMMVNYAKNQLQETEFIVVFTGAEEVNGYGMIEFLKKHGGDLRQAYFVNLDNIGAGTPVFASVEGLFFSHKADRELLKLARKVQKTHSELNIEERAYRASPTDGTAAMVKGYKVISFLALDDNNIPLNWHWETDTVENIEENTLKTVEEFVKILIKEIDQDTSLTSVTKT